LVLKKPSLNLLPANLKPENWGLNLALPSRLGFEKTKFKVLSAKLKPKNRELNSTIPSRLGFRKTEG
jgi:hypothetical protein